MRTRRTNLGDPDEPVEAESTVNKEESETVESKIPDVIEESETEAASAMAVDSDPVGPETDSTSTKTVTQDESVADQTAEDASSSDKMEVDAPSKEVEGVLDEEKVLLAEGQTSEAANSIDCPDESVNNSKQTEGISSSMALEPDAKTCNAEKPDQGAGAPGQTSLESSSSVAKKAESETVNTEKPLNQSDDDAEEDNISWKLNKYALEIMQKAPNDRTFRERKYLASVRKEKTQEAIKFGKKLCKKYNIVPPNDKTFDRLIFKLLAREELSGRNLKAALKESEGRRLDMVGLQKEEPTDDSLIVPDQELDYHQWCIIREKYRLYAEKYCQSKKITLPGKKKLGAIINELKDQKKMNAKEFKLLLDMHGSNITNIVETHNNKVKDTLKAHKKKVKESQRELIQELEEPDLLPLVVKPMNEMTVEERVEFFNVLRTLQTKLKPIAIRHCHKIKAPFPSSRVYKEICRSLFNVGMLDEENIKIGMEKAFERLIDAGDLTEGEVSLIARQYLKEKGIVDKNNDLRLETGNKASSDASVVKDTSATSDKSANLETNKETSSKPKSPEQTQKLEKKVKEDQPKWSNRWSVNKIEQLHKMGLPRLKGSTPVEQASNQGAPRGNVTNNQKMVAKKNTQSSSPQKPPARNVPSLMDLPRGTKYNAPNSSRYGAPNYLNSRDVSAWNTSNTYGINRDTTCYSQASDVESLGGLLSLTQNLISKNELLLGGPQNQRSSVSQSGSWQRENVEQRLSRRQRAKLRKENDQEYGGVTNKRQRPGKNQLQRAAKSHYENDRQHEGMTNNRQIQPLGKRERLPSPPYQQSRGSHYVSTYNDESYQRDREYDCPAQNRLISNYTSHSNYSGQSSGLNSQGRNRSESSRDDYNERGGYNTDYRKQDSTYDNHSRPYYEDDPMEGTSQRWSDQDRRSPPRIGRDEAKGYMGRKNYDERYADEFVAPPPPPKIPSLTATSSSRNSNDQSARKKNDDWRYYQSSNNKKSQLDDDWRFARSDPPQKKSRFDEGVRQSATSLSTVLESEMKKFDSWMDGDSKRGAEPSHHQISDSSWDRPILPKNEAKINHGPPTVTGGKVCKVGIRHEDYPRLKITSEEAQLIRDALLERIGAQEGVGPRFSDTYEDQGAVVFECEDQLSVSWLWLNACTIVPWRGAKLRPISMDKTRTEIAVQVPKILQSLTPQALCDRLMSQNPNLSTKDWKLKSSNLTSSGEVELNFFVDDQSCDALKALNCKPYLGFSRVNVRVIQG